MNLTLTPKYAPSHSIIPQAKHFRREHLKTIVSAPTHVEGNMQKSRQHSSEDGQLSLKYLNIRRSFRDGALAAIVCATELGNACSAARREVSGVVRLNGCYAQASVYPSSNKLNASLIAFQ